MGRALRVGVVLSAGEWWRRLHAHAADHGSDVEVVVVRDVHAVVESGLQVVCVDDRVVWFTKAFVAEVESAGIAVVGVRTAGDAGSDAYLEGLGIKHRVNDSVVPSALLELVVQLRPADSFDEIVASLDVIRAAAGGSLTVVGGPPGAGAREVAIGIAGVLATDSSTVLVDCNEASPGVARRLGLRLQPHVLDAAEAVSSGGDLRAAVAKPAEGLRGSRLAFDVICGLASPSEWQRLSRDGVDAVIEACRREWRYTVVTTSPVIEDLRRWIDRYGVSRHLVGSGPVVVGVCEATPRGVLRFVDWLADAEPAVTVGVVINKSPASRFVVGELVEQLCSLCGDRIRLVGSVPFDRRVVAAEWDALLPTPGAFTRAVQRVVGALVSADEPSRAEVRA